MFRYRTAWFSSSVLQSCHDFWRSEGGILASWRTADYLFSDDASCPDTLRLFESKDYRWNKVTVFHSLFLSACEKRRSVKSVCIGHYVLPPAAVQEEVRNVMGRFIWEREDEPSRPQISYKDSTHNTEDEHGESLGSRSSCETCSTEVKADEASLCCENSPVGNALTGYVNMDNLQKYCGDLRDFHPSCYRCAKCNAHCCQLSSEY